MQYAPESRTRRVLSLTPLLRPNGGSASLRAVLVVNVVESLATVVVIREHDGQVLGPVAPDGTGDRPQRSARVQQQHDERRDDGALHRALAAARLRGPRRRSGRPGRLQGC
ncbi:hypothetical protein HPB50_029231 [Hyalomma asiaticum]|nr:hypothetical protein HPB50_029231 [Hyalomma asiaticum]